MTAKLIITISLVAGTIGLIWYLFHNDPLLAGLGTVGATMIGVLFFADELSKLRN